MPGGASAATYLIQNMDIYGHLASRFLQLGDRPGFCHQAVQSEKVRTKTCVHTYLIDL